MDEEIPGRYYIRYKCSGSDPPHTWFSMVGKNGKKKKNKKRCRKHDCSARDSVTVMECRVLKKSVSFASFLELSYFVVL